MPRNVDFIAIRKTRAMDGRTHTSLHGLIVDYYWSRKSVQMASHRSPPPSALSACISTGVPTPCNDRPQSTTFIQSDSSFILAYLPDFMPICGRLSTKNQVSVNGHYNIIAARHHHHISTRIVAFPGAFVYRKYQTHLND